jgi:hypothetical protein
VRHRVAITLGLRHTRGKVIGHRTQLDQPPKRGFGFNSARAWDLGYPCAIFLRLVRQALYARC